MKKNTALKITVGLGFLFFLVIFGVLTGLKKTDENRGSVKIGANTKREELKFRLKWLIYSGFTPHFVALEKGYFARENLAVEIQPGGPGVDPLKLVLTGEADIGLASYDQILLAREKKLPLVAIGEDTITSGVGFLCLSKAGIKTPHDFVGKKVGVMPGTDKGTMYEALMAKLSIDRSRIEEIPVQFNLSVLLNGTVDVFPAFLSNQPIAARAAGFDVTVINPADYGISIGGNVFFTSEKILAEKRPLLTAFLRAELAAIMDSQAMNDNEAVACVLKYNPQLVPDTEIEIWRSTKSLLSPKNRSQAGVMRPETWRETARLFQEAGILKTVSDIDSYYTNALVEEVHRTGY